MRVPIREILVGKSAQALLRSGILVASAPKYRGRMKEQPEFPDPQIDNLALRLQD